MNHGPFHLSSEDAMTRPKKPATDDLDGPAENTLPDDLAGDSPEDDLPEDDPCDDESLDDLEDTSWDDGHGLDLELDDEPDPEPGDFWMEPDEGFD